MTIGSIFSDVCCSAGVPTSLQPAIHLQVHHSDISQKRAIAEIVVLELREHRSYDINTLE